MAKELESELNDKEENIITLKDNNKDLEKIIKKKRYRSRKIRKN